MSSIVNLIEKVVSYGLGGVLILFFLVMALIGIKHLLERREP